MEEQFILRVPPSVAERIERLLNEGAASSSSSSSSSPQDQPRPRGDPDARLLRRTMLPRLLPLKSSPRRSRSLLLFLPLGSCHLQVHLLVPPAAATRTHCTSAGPLPFVPFVASSASPDPDFDAALVASSFKEWFRHARPYTALDRVFDALARCGDADDAAVDGALTALRLRLNEALVIQVLRHSPCPSSAAAAAAARDPRAAACGNNFLLLRLKFFDWAGRQHGFRHTRATYHAIFRRLSRARLMSVVVDWLEAFAASRRQLPGICLHRRHVRFHETLVLGYAVAGRTDVALQMFARMRFQGLDLDVISYHVLFNSLVEESAFDAAETVYHQISARGLSNPYTYCIRMKSLCRQNRLDEANAFLWKLEEEVLEHRDVANHIVGVLIDALCKRRRFEEASRLVEKFGPSRAYGVWIRGLVDAGRTGKALDFLHDKKESEDYVPDLFFYNKLLCQLLKENRLEEVYQILVEMRDERIAPDMVTMNSALCFFCKAGMVDVALMLYKSRLEYGLSPNSLAYNQLINALCTMENMDEVCQILEDSIKHGYFPGKQTFHILAAMLCQKGELDKMEKLLDMALQINPTQVAAACSRYIAALCSANRPEDAYSVLQKVVGVKNPQKIYVFTSLIRGYIQLKRGDMACKLLMEMEDSGHLPSRRLLREIICCLCDMGNYEQVLNLLEKQLARQEINPRTCYHRFIYGAGYAKRHELAMEVFLHMRRFGIEPTVHTSILVLESYLKSGRISDALNFFYGLCKEREPSNRLYNILIVGLSKARKLDQSLSFWREVRGKGIIPSLYCYEELVHAFCSVRDYYNLVKILRDFEETGRQVSSFICNLLLLHTLKNPKLSETWDLVGVLKNVTELKDASSEASHSRRLTLHQLVSAFSGGVRNKEHLDCLEEVIERDFPVDIFTYNMLLRALTMAGRMVHACQLFDRICMKGHQPNQYTYDTILHGFCKQGRKEAAALWKNEMTSRGFFPTGYTSDLYNTMLTKT
uniref:Pentatricopeptide repeat-containing protein At1g71210 n=1 Tax=Anthurium amnicola TaxID=1678845 RepID=A0A1D1XF30_9ARAE